MGLRLARQTAHASVEWVMGRYFTPDALLRDRKQKCHEIKKNIVLYSFMWHVMIFIARRH